MCHVTSGPGAGRAGREEEGYQGFWLLRVSLLFPFSPHCVILSTSWYMVLPFASIVTLITQSNPRRHASL